MDNTLFFLITFSLILDQVLGDPHSKWHPVAVFGRCSQIFEKYFRMWFSNDFLAGSFACIILCIVPSALQTGICHVLRIFYGVIGEIIQASVFLYITIAPRSLLEHIDAIRKPIEQGNITQARRALSMIVSRKTDDLPACEIVRGALESLSENLVDGVFSAFFWTIFFYFLFDNSPSAQAFGCVLLRCVNTLDACWGYKNEKYLYFGRFAARWDDVMHWIPARLTALLIATAGIFFFVNPMKTLRMTVIHAKDHPSPNSCWSMVAYAFVLKVRLGGRTVYSESEIADYPVWDGGSKSLDQHALSRGMILTCVVILLFEILVAMQSFLL